MYQFIKGHSSKLLVKKMCQLLDLSGSNYYVWLNRRPSKREREDAKLVELIRKSHQESGGIYGVDKIHQDVKELQPCSRKRIYQLMKANNIYSKRPRKFKATTNSKHNLPVAEKRP